MGKILFKSVVLLLLLAFSPTILAAHTANVTKQWIEFNKVQNGESGMIVHVNFNIYNCKGVKCKLILYENDSNGKPIKDLDGRMCTVDGNVSFSTDFTPSYNNSVYEDLTIFVANKDLHGKQGTHDYYLSVKIYDGSFFLNKAKSVVRFSNAVNVNSSNQNSNSNNNQNSKGNQSSWRQDLPNGGYVDYVQYADGTVATTSHNPCVICQGSKQCQVCHGTLGTYNAYTGIFYPCTSCFQTGVCQFCKGKGYSILRGTIKNGVGVAYDENGKMYLGGGDKSADHDKTYNNGNSNSNSSRYGNYSCPQCSGSGNCRTCNGTGFTSSSYTGGSMVCPNCMNGHPGKCASCSGTGKKYGVK